MPCGSYRQRGGRKSKDDDEQYNVDPKIFFKQLTGYDLSEFDKQQGGRVIDGDVELPGDEQYNVDPKIFFEKLTGYKLSDFEKELDKQQKGGISYRRRR